MKWHPGSVVSLLLLLILLLSHTLSAAEPLRIATYNLENYLAQPTPTRPQRKTPESRAKIRESIRALHPDVLALQEIGGPPALEELRASLKAEGLHFPHSELVTGFDTNIQIAVLSRFPITARRPHTNQTYLLAGRRFRVSRGFAEVDIQVNPAYAFTLITAHLKSKRPVPDADEAEQRLQEARLLRTLINSRLAQDPDINLVVLGDFNDTPDASPVKTLLGRGTRRLTDTRPGQRRRDDPAAGNPDAQPRTVTWTHYYGIQDTYSRIDYILLSPGMAREWVRSGSGVLALPGWGTASDHRPLVAAFEARNK